MTEYQALVLKVATELLAGSSLVNDSQSIKRAIAEAEELIMTVAKTVKLEGNF